MAKALRLGLIFIALSSSAATSLGAAYDETSLGDLSDAPGSPTPWTLELGANLLTGHGGRTADSIDYDLVAFTIPAGQRLGSIDVTSYQNVDEFALAFFALEAGPAWTDGLGFAINGEAMMGWSHVDSSMTGADLLQEIQSHASDPVFDIPLPSGVYTMLIQEIDTTFDYSLTFIVVPEPAAVGLSAIAALATAVVGRRRFRRR